MSKQIITFQIETEVDATLASSLFDERGIPYTIKKNSDLFPYTGERRPFAEILVFSEFEKDAQKIFEEIAKTRSIETQDDPESENKPDNNKTRKQQRWKTILIVYSLVTTVLLIKYWDMNRKNSESKNLQYAWSLDNTKLLVRHKKTDHLMQIYIDDNSDLNFEKMEVYSNNVLNSTSTDFDEDGFFDRVTYFGRNGNVAGDAADHDSDGWMDESLVIMQNGDTLLLLDKDEDGFFELAKK